jgi:hypothetical protein
MPKAAFAAHAVLLLQQQQQQQQLVLTQSENQYKIVTKWFR